MFHLYCAIHYVQIYTVLKKKNDSLCEKLSLGKHSTDKDLAALSSSVYDLEKLNEMGRNLHLEVGAVLAILEDQESDLVQINVARRIAKIRDNMPQFVKGIFRYQRTPATHILVTMISPSQRNKKPYALPVSCIPYASITEKKARQHINQVLVEMKKRNMKVAGKFST